MGQEQLILDHPVHLPAADAGCLAAIGLYPLNGPSAGTHEVQMVGRDITDRRKAEIALRESRQQLSSILDNLQDVVFSLAWPSLEPQFFSPSTSALFGRQPAEFIAESSLFFSIIHDDYRDEVELIMLAQLEEVGECIYEYLIILPNGDERWVANHARIITDESGEKIRCDGVVTDITASKQAEEDILQVNRELELASDRARDIWPTRPSKPIKRNPTSLPI